MKIQLIITETKYGPSILGHIGTVTDVIAGHLPADLAKRRFNAVDYAYGFELGTPKNAESLGEAIMVNGICYATSTDKQAGSEYKHLIYGPQFMTSGIFIIPHEAKPSHLVNFSMTKEPINMLNFYDKLYQEINKPLAFVALVKFTELHATAISKPPINDKNIFQHHDEYYADPAIQLKQVDGFIMGAVTNYQEAKDAVVNKALEVVLYRNPFDTNLLLTHHAHVLTLKNEVRTFSEIKPALADKALHLLVDTSFVSVIQAQVYTIEAVKNYA